MPEPLSPKIGLDWARRCVRIFPERSDYREARVLGRTEFSPRVEYHRRSPMRRNFHSKLLFAGLSVLPLIPALAQAPPAPGQAQAPRGSVGTESGFAVFQ